MVYLAKGLGLGLRGICPEKSTRVYEKITRGIPSEGVRVMGIEPVNPNGLRGICPEKSTRVYEKITRGIPSEGVRVMGIEPVNPKVINGIMR